MNYRLLFHPKALKEWRKLSKSISSDLKKILIRRLDNPHIASARLRGDLSNCYKIKLKNSGYRLIYKVDDERIEVLVLSVGKRDNEQAYDFATKRNK